MSQQAQNIRAILVDDEEHARELLHILIRENCPRIKVVGEAATVDEAYEKISLSRPDVVFLDVKLRSKTAFDLLNRFEHIFFQIVFTTAFDRYALRAFDYSALHYLLKPIDVSQLEVTAKRLESSMLHLKFTSQSPEIEENNLEAVQKIALSNHTATKFVALNQIECMEAEGSYTRFFMVDGTQKTASKALRHFEEVLNPNEFCRVHRSYIVNLLHIVGIEKNRAQGLVLASERVIPVSSVFKDELLTKLKRRVSF